MHAALSGPNTQQVLSKGGRREARALDWAPPAGAWRSGLHSCTSSQWAAQTYSHPSGKAQQSPLPKCRAVQSYKACSHL